MNHCILSLENDILFRYQNVLFVRIDGVPDTTSYI